MQKNFGQFYNYRKVFSAILKVSIDLQEEKLRFSMLSVLSFQLLLVKIHWPDHKELHQKLQSNINGLHQNTVIQDACYIKTKPLANTARTHIQNQWMLNTTELLLTKAYFKGLSLSQQTRAVCFPPAPQLALIPCSQRGSQLVARMSPCATCQLLQYSKQMDSSSFLMPSAKFLCFNSALP